MATIEERKTNKGVRYRAKVRLRGFPVQSATFKRLTDAKTWIQDTEVSIRQGKYFKYAKSSKYTFAELIDRYIEEVLKFKPNNTANQKHYLNWWKSQLGSYRLSDISSAQITACRNKLVGQENKYGREIGTSTVNRYTTALGHVYTVAMNEWEIVESNPVRKIKKFSEPRGRVRFLSEKERNDLLQACKESENPYLHIIVILALSTGARKNEIVSLKWQDIEFQRGLITLHKTKNGERRSIPLKGHAYTLLIAHSKVRSLKCDYVFPSKSKCQPIDIRTAWENAVKKAELKDFRYHDLRHSAASYLAMNGATLIEIKDVLGHKTLQMVMRYAHLTENHTSMVIEKMNRKVFG